MNVMQMPIGPVPMSFEVGGKLIDSKMTNLGSSVVSGQKIGLFLHTDPYLGPLETLSSPPSNSIVDC